MPLILVFAFAVLQNVNGVTETGYKLLQVQAVSRHGVRERTKSNNIPSLTCPSFTNFQMVTELGHQQNYKSGKGLRDTYDTHFFTSGEYVPANHIFQSTDEPKTILSTQSVFQGVFYEKYPTLDLSAFPTPPSYISGPIDNVLMASTICKTKIDELRESTDLLNSDKWKTKQSEYTASFGDIYDAAGFGPTEPGTPGKKEALTLNTIPRAAEQIILAYEHGFTHPGHQCVYAKIPTDLNKVAIEAATFRNQMQNRPYNTSDADGEIAKLQASPYFNNVIREFLTKTGKTTQAQLEERSFIYVSGDNANILSPIQLVGRESFGRAPFGSVFFFELWVDENKGLPYKEEDLRVKVGWRNFLIKDYNVSAFDNGPIGNHPLVEALGLGSYSYTTVPGQIEWYTEDLCGSGKTFCTIAELRKRIYTDAEWTNKCFCRCEICNNETGGGLNKSQSDNNLNATGTTLLIVLIVLAVLLVVAIIAAVIFFVRAKVATAKAEAAAGGSAPSSSSSKAAEKGSGSGSGASGSAPAASTHQKSGNAETEVEAGDYMKD